MIVVVDSQKYDNRFRQLEIIIIEFIINLNVDRVEVFTYVYHKKIDIIKTRLLIH